MKFKFNPFNKEIMWTEDNKPSPDELEDMKAKLFAELEKLI